MKKVNLSELVNALEMQSYESQAWLDTKFGTILWLLDDDDGYSDFDEDEEEEGEGGESEEEEAVAGADELEPLITDGRMLAKAIAADASNRFLALPDRYAVAEPDIVRHYISDLEDRAIAAALDHAFHGRGAFRRFRDALDRHDLRDDWFDYRRHALAKIAVDWCEAHEVPWVADLAAREDGKKADEARRKRERYGALLRSVRAVLEGERDPVANAANVAATLAPALTKVNWLGFYFLRGEDLVLGPFHGPPACTRIGPGKGVCGQAVQRRQTLVVPNVHEFPGHIACDPASKSEIVVPLVKDGGVVGVLDVDSAFRARFDAEDARGLEAIAAAYLAGSDFTGS